MNICIQKLAEYGYMETHLSAMKNKNGDINNQNIIWKEAENIGTKKNNFKLFI